jgi:hypothetical protein
MSNDLLGLSFENISEENVLVLTDLIVDPLTPEPLKVKILQKFIEAKQDQPFFSTMMEEKLDFGPCPNPECAHENHWLVPETELNQRGVVTAEIDPRVKAFTTAEDCPQYQEACAKKKVCF